MHELVQAQRSWPEVRLNDPRTHRSELCYRRSSIFRTISRQGFRDVKVPWPNFPRRCPTLHFSVEEARNSCGDFYNHPGRPPELAEGNFASSRPNDAKPNFLG